MTDLTQAQLERLKGLAEKATPGPWTIGGQIHVWRRFLLDDGRRASTPVAECTGAENADFIAAVNPQTILSLITQVSALQAKLEEATAVVEKAKALHMLEDFGEPIGPDQHPQDWDAYNATRRELYEALTAFHKQEA